MRASSRIVILVVLAGAVLSPPRESDACAPAPPRNVVVETASESAVIVWDAKTKTQHFIRRAAFNAAGKDAAPVSDFGFLVPTPNKPELAEVEDRAFEELAKITAPKTDTVPRPSGGCGIGCGGGGPGPAGKSDVEVLEAKHVAGYDATVLKASDAAALTKWLADHGYDSRPALTRWLDPYVKKGWVVTAFKIARDPSLSAGAAIGTTAVRMSFQTDDPFFPYSEPDDSRDAKGKRLLRVFFLSATKMKGVVMSDGPADQRKAWDDGKIVWAGKPTAENWNTLLPLFKIPGYTPPEGAWLTEFEDHSSPRKADADVAFVPHHDAEAVERPHNRVYAKAGLGTGPAATYAGCAAAIACLYILRRRSRVGVPG